MTEKTCKRDGCTKVLRSNNATGECGSGCESPDAPYSKRAVGVGGGEPAVKRGRSETMKRFRAVAGGLGKDPDEILEEAASAWLDALVKAAEGK